VTLDRQKRQNAMILLGAGVLRDGFGALRHGVLGQCIFNLSFSVYFQSLISVNEFPHSATYIHVNQMIFSVFSIFQFQCIFNLSISVYFQSFNFSVFSFFQFQCIFNLNYSNSRLGIPLPIKNRIYFNFQSIFIVFSILKTPTPA
jgi:hypothetical protein